MPKSILDKNIYLQKITKWDQKVADREESIMIFHADRDTSSRQPVFTQIQPIQSEPHRKAIYQK